MGPEKRRRYEVPSPLWTPAFAGVRMALRGPRKRMKIAGCRILGWDQAPALRDSPTPGLRLSLEYLCWMSRIFGWLGWGIVVCAGHAPPGGQAPALQFSPSTTSPDGGWSATPLPLDSGFRRTWFQRHTPVFIPAAAGTPRYWSCGLVQPIDDAGDKPPRYIFPWTTRSRLTIRQELRRWRARAGANFVPTTELAGATGTVDFSTNTHKVGPLSVNS